MKDPYTVVKTVRVTEKGSAQTEALNQYQVVVEKHANKIDVKRAVEQLFKVKVLRVNTLNVRGRRGGSGPCSLDGHPPGRRRLSPSKRATRLNWLSDLWDSKLSDH